MKIKSIKKGKNETVYDICVNNHHNYILENGIITHNSGLIYAASTILMLAKKKDKDGTEVVGNIIKVKTYKSRLSKENAEVELQLSYKRGLDRYYGLLPLCEKYDVIRKSGRQYELPTGAKVFGKQIIENPEEVFTEEILSQIDEVAKKEFRYG